MGNGMVKNLLKRGYEVNAYTRTRAKALEALDAGAVWCDTTADCVRDVDAVISMVGFPPDVEEVYFGEKGILANARPGTLVIDMTTTSPRLAQRIYTEAADKGLPALDAPRLRRRHGRARRHAGHHGRRRPRGFRARRSHLRGHGQQHSLYGPGRQRPAYENGQPDRHCRHAGRRVRGHCLCPRGGSGTWTKSFHHFRRRGQLLAACQQRPQERPRRLCPRLLHQALHQGT